jgi:hypothetical protein
VDVNGVPPRNRAGAGPRCRPLSGALLAAPIAALAVLVAAPAQAAIRYRIDATLDPDESLVEGTVVLTVDDAAGEELLLWLYPRRFAAEPPQLDERNAWWIYPSGFDAGDMELTSCTTAAGDECTPAAGTDAGTVRVPAGSGTSRQVTLGFRTTIPERFGLFGRVGDMVVLGGGWHPLLAGRAADGSFDPRAPIERADYALRLHVRPGWQLVVDGTGPFRCGEDESLGCRVERETSAAEPPSVVLSPELYERSVDAAGVRVRVLSPDETRDPATYAAGEGEGLDPATVPDLWSIDRLGWLLDRIEDSLRSLEEEALLPPADRRPAEVTMIVAPLRLELAAGISGAVLVSDRAYELFPIEPFFQFQDADVLRAVVAELVRGALAALPLAEARWTAETLAAGAVERLAERAGEGGRRAEDWLKYGAFLPVIDQMIYAPLMEFRDAYYAAIEESDSLHDEIWRFPTELPRGRRIWAKLRDRLGAAAACAAMRELVASGGPLEAAAARATGDDLAGFRDLWLGRYPSINLRLVDFVSVPEAEGRWRIRVRLHRDGDVGAREFVTVRVKLEDGTTSDRTWDAATPDGEVTFVASSPAAAVDVDPDGRVVQDATLTDNHPRADDVSSLPWRLPVLERFRLSLDLGELANSEVDIDFGLRRRYDLHQFFRLRFTRDLRGIGGSFTYTHGFGPPRDMNRPSWTASGYMEVFHYDDAFGGGGSSATTMEFGAYVNHDDRWFDLNPADGWQALLGVGGSFPLDDTGPWTIRSGGRAFYLWSPAIGHTLAVFGGFGLTFGEPVRAQLEALGDRLLLEAFAPDEALGRAKLYAVAEYRHVYSWDLDLNLFHLAWLRGLQGVLFVGAGTSSRRDSLAGLFDVDRLYFEAGYGLRAFLDYLGAQTGIIALDFGVPFAIVDGDFGVPKMIMPDPGDSRSWRRRPSLFGLPVSVRLSFSQSF